MVCNRAGSDKNQTDFKRKGGLQAVEIGKICGCFPFLILLSLNFAGLVTLMRADVAQPPKDPDKSLAIFKDIGISY